MKTLGAVGNLIKEKTDAKERATIKGAEIAKLGSLARRNVKFSGADFDIEVVSFNPIEGGVEVFARAWDADGQIGFGKDGSVDIERFRIFNPPILVADGTQTLTEDRDGNPLLLDNFKEDAELAILQSLAHIIKVKKQKHGSESIIQGVVGNTTSTFYPDASPESTSVDGFVWQEYSFGSGVAWGTIRAAAGSSANDGDQVLDAVVIVSDTVSNQWIRIRRSIILYDTSALGSDIIDSATLSLYGSAKADGLSITPDINIYSSAPASNTALVAGDYDSLGATAFSTAITYAGWSTTGYNDFALNASGLAAITGAGVSKFGTRNANYDVANSAPTWGSASESNLKCRGAETSGTSQDPKLVVEHAAPVTNLSLSESVGITERLTRAWTAPRSQSDVLILQGESISRTLNSQRSPSDVVTITETVTGIKGRIIEILETLGINESFTRSWSAGRSFSESLGITESLSMGRIFGRVLSEVVSITEYISSSVTIIRTLVLSELVSIIDTVRTPLNWLKRTKPTTTWTKRTKP